jgi:peroxiredoxin
MINSATILAALSLLTAAGNLASYYPKMKSNRATLRPRREQAFMVLALLLVVAAFFLHPGIIGYVLGAIAVVPASLFLLGTFTSGLPSQQPAVAVDALSPDFSGLDADGEEFRLSNLRGSPILLKFYRGYWCPYCVAELTQLNQFAGDFEALGIKLVAVSSDRVDELRPFKGKQNWAIRLVADPALAIHRLYNVQHRNFTPKRSPFREIAIPTTILIDRDGRVLWHQRTTDFRVRPQADMVLAKARALLAIAEPAVVTESSCDACAA